jgi:ubiquinone/menaquinone biosynthesis C-methylase UbiE
MNDKKLDFDKLADTWDEKPQRIELAKDIAEAIAGEISLRADMDVLDFGCGTGLLTLRLQPKVRSVTGVDSSRGMLAVLEGKIARQHLNNIRTLYCDLDAGDVLTGSYPLIVISMTLHHVKEIAPLFAQFHNVLAPSGHLCVADLDLDGGLFHEESEGVFHNGFDRAQLREVFKEAGFDDIHDITAAKVTKPAADGELRTFSVFLMTGRKSSR